MKPRAFEPKIRHPRVWLSLGGAVIFGLVLFVAWQAYFVQAYNEPTHSPPAPSVAKQPLKRSSFQQTRHQFGPWELAAPNSTGAPRLVMLLATGSVDVSSKVIHHHQGWKRATAIDIIPAVAGLKTVLIQALNGNTFKLAYGQAFILATRPDVVYCFVHHGLGKATLVSTTVTALQKR